MTQRVVNYTYGTGNPVLPNGSIDVRDGIDNLQSFDIFMNAGEDTYNQRDGDIVQTVSGVIRKVGFQNGSGDFSTGFTVMPGERNVAWYDPVSMNWYSYLGVIPVGGHTVSPGANPVGDVDWKATTDALLRNDLLQGFDGLFIRVTTVSETATGLFPVGAKLSLSDRADGIFSVVSGGTPNGTYILDAGNGNTAVYTPDADGVVNVKALGGKSGIDSSLAVKHALSLSTKVHFPDDDVYEISYDVNNGNRSFFTYNNESFIRITGDAATIKDVSVFNVGTSYLVDVLKFVNCTDIYINVNCDATPVPDLTAPFPEGLGYKGSSFIYLEGFCQRVTVDCYAKNVRYGVRQGSYSNVSFGGANDITVRMKAYQVGYPVAFYRASNIKLDIDSNVQHRAAYLAGCSNVRGTVAQAGFTYAHMGVVLSDSITVSSDVDADRRAIGCSNVHINVVDRGTTGTQSNRAVAGMNGSWKAPNITHDDIHIHLSALCNNANRTLAGFRLENTVGWMSTNEYNNIKVSGLIDRRAQTLSASSYADFSIEGIEAGEVGPYPNSPKFNGIDLSELQVINAAVTGNSSQILTPNAVGVINLRGAKMAGASISTNAPNARIVLTNAAAASVSGPGVKFPTVNTAANGYRVNDDGFIEQWMLVNYTATANTDQTFTLPTPFLVAARSPTVTPSGVASITATVTAFTTSSITIRCSTTGASVYIRATGY